MLLQLLERLQLSLFSLDALRCTSGTRRKRPPLRLCILETRDLPATVLAPGPIASPSYFLPTEVSFRVSAFTSTSNAVTLLTAYQGEPQRDSSPQLNQPLGDLPGLLQALRQTPESAGNSQVNLAGALQGHGSAAFFSIQIGTPSGINTNVYVPSIPSDSSAPARDLASTTPAQSFSSTTGWPSSTSIQTNSTGTPIEQGPASTLRTVSSGSLSPTATPTGGTQQSLPGNTPNSVAASQAPAQSAVSSDSAIAPATELPAMQPVTQLQNIKPTAPSVDLISGEAAATTVAGQLPSVAQSNSVVTAVLTNGTGGSASNGAAHAALSDATLLALFVGGDQGAFRQLVQRYSQIVTMTCRRVLGHTDRVGDATQTTFLALARRAAYLDPRNGLGGWLRRVACRMALRCRSTDRRQREVEQLAARVPTSDQAFARVDARDTEQVVREELDRLPEMYRLPLVLCYLNGCTHAEVATEIGIPRGSVAKRLNDGLILLRQVLIVRGVQL